MLFVMHSEMFFEYFLVNEDYKIIKDAQIIVVSNSIRKRRPKEDNIICLNHMIYPNSEVLSKGTFDDMHEAYEEQLKQEALPFLSTVIKGVIKKNYNVFFICSKKEWKLKYLKWLEEFIDDFFGFPVYNYLDYICDNYYKSYDKYDKKMVLKRCNQIIEVQNNRDFDQYLETSHGKKQLLKRYKGMSRKELRKECKLRGCSFMPDASKSDLLTVLVDEFDLENEYSRI